MMFVNKERMVFRGYNKEDTMKRKRRMILTALFVNQEKKKTFHTCVENVKLWSI